MSTNETTERRLTPSERSHELLKLAMERPQPSSSKPSFSVSQTKATGGAVVFEWEVHVPVCDEFPTASVAWEACVDYARAMRDEFSGGATNGGEGK